MQMSNERIEKESQKIKDKPIKPPVVPDNPRIASVQPPDKPCTYNEWQAVIKANFPDLLFSAEICLSIISQILITDVTNPFALVLVDVPSAGKTITLNFFSGIDSLTYSTDKFTPAAFVSNAANVKKSEIASVDLLPRIKNKGLIVRDFATIFSKREDDLNDLLGTLTRVLDGEGLNTDSGVHGKRHLDGDYLFMMLAASTPVPHKVWRMMSSIGSRLFFLNLNMADKSDDELAAQLGSMTFKYRERACKAVTHHLLSTLWSQNSDGVNWDNGQDDPELIIIIPRCARLLASLRGVVTKKKTVSEKGQSKISFSEPTIEKPDRINQLFYNLARGHAVACGRRFLTTDDMRFAVELAIDSAPRERSTLIKALLQNGGHLSTKEVKALLDCSTPTALNAMKEFQVLKLGTLKKDISGKVGEPEKILKLAKDFDWFIGEEFRSIRNLNVINKENLTPWDISDE
jgi:hypothetical protein